MLLNFRSNTFLSSNFSEIRRSIALADSIRRHEPGAIEDVEAPRVQGRHVRDIRLARIPRQLHHTQGVTQNVGGFLHESLPAILGVSSIG